MGSLRLEEILWRRVQTREGERLGTVNDLLVQFPGGHIVYVSVLPDQLFGRPRAVSPDTVTVPVEPDAPLVTDLSFDRWINSPIVDWSEALVLDLTEQGGKVRAYYQPSWLESPPGIEWSIDRAVPPEARTDLPAFLSLRKLDYKRLQPRGSGQVGNVRDFLLDWNTRRVTHVLVSSAPAAAGGLEENGFAVPVALIGPAPDRDVLSVSREANAFRTAASFPPDAVLPTDTAQIYRYKLGRAAGEQAAE